MNIGLAEQLFSAANPPRIHDIVGLNDPDLIESPQGQIATTGRVCGFTDKTKETAFVVLDGEPQAMRRVATAGLWKLAR